MKRTKLLSLLMSLIMLITVLPTGAVSTMAASRANITVESKSAFAGSTIDVNVSISANPGILGAVLTLSYDSGLTLTGASSGDAFSALQMTKPGVFTSPCRFSWDGIDLSDGDIKDGTILTLSFKVSDTLTAGTKKNIKISYSSGDIVDSNLNSVELSITNGNIDIIDYNPGDLNNDGVINTTDVIILRRYIVGGYNININEMAADVNADGKINSTDTITMRRYIVGGYGIELKPGASTHTHSLVKTERAEATCTQNGNIAYWHCADCGKYFSDANGVNEIAQSQITITASHNLTHFAYKAPTTSSQGNIEHWHCSVCDKYFTSSSASAASETTYDKVVIEKIKQEESTIVYDLYGGDAYLESVGVENNPDNPVSFVASEGTPLSDIINAPAGYRFRGWQNSSGAVITEIEPGKARTINLYAKWETIEYEVDFVSTSNSNEAVQTLAKSVPDNVTYTVNKGISSGKLTQYAPIIPGYRWLGWSDSQGNLVDSINPGTTGKITLYTNWVSEWNRAVAISPDNYEKPDIYEEDGKYYFTYHIGEIENTVLDVLSEAKYYTQGGPEQTFTITSENTVSDSSASAVAETIAQATTKSSTWSLSKNWNNISSTSRSHSEQTSSYLDTVDQKIRSGNASISLNKQEGASEDKTVNWGVNAKIYGKNTTEVGAEAKVPVECVEVGVSAKNTMEVGGEINGHYENTTVNKSYWNTDESFNASRSFTNTTSVSSGSSQSSCDTFNVSNTYSEGGSTTNEQTASVTDSKQETYSTAFTYANQKTDKTTKTVKISPETTGYWRSVNAGRVAVFAVVIYDTKTSTYSVSTQGVLRTDTIIRESMQKSMEGGAFDDNQNMVIPFEVPFFVQEYINNAIGYSNDLDIDIDTGIVNGYIKEKNVTDKHLHIPDYFTQDNGDGTYTIAKITGIAPGAFKNKTSIESVRLGRYITAIPNNAFEGCTKLKTIDADSITSIGNNAFSGCTSLENYVVDKAVAILGTNAFTNVKSLTVNAANPSVAETAISSGAKTLVVNLNTMKDGNTASEKLQNKILLVSPTTVSFTLNGRDANGNVRNYSNVRIDSKATGSTTINGMTFTDNSATPLKIYSENLTLNGVNVEPFSGAAVILGADNTNIILQGKNTLSTNGIYAVLCKNISVSRASGSNITTYLRVNKGDVYVCGSVTDNYDYLQQSNGEKMTTTTAQKIVEISDNSYQQLINDSIDWVLASQAPVGAQIISEKWTYDLTTTATSTTSKTMDGYSYVSTTTETTYGAWQSKNGTWSSGSKPADTDTTKYTSGTVYGYYYYPCSKCGAHNHVYSGCYTWNGGCGNGSSSYDKYQSTWLPVSPTGSSVTQNWQGTGRTRYNDTTYGFGQCFYNSSDGTGRSGYHVTSTRTKTTTNIYHFSKTESLESTTEITVDSVTNSNQSISNIQKWVKYVAK